MDWEIIRNKAEILDEMPKKIGEISSSYSRRPFPNSQASQELKDCSNKELLEIAYYQGVLQHFVSSDHMSALKRTLEPTVLSFAPWTCARVVLETCSLGVWLLDTEINSKERITRSLNLRLEDENQKIKLLRKKLERISNQDQIAELPQKQKANALIEESEIRIKCLEEKAEESSIAVTKNRKNDLIGFGSGGPPNISDRIDATFKAKDDYAMFSSAAHGNPSMILSLGVNIEQSKKGPLTPDLDPDDAMWLIMKTVEWFARTSWTYFNLFGRELKELQFVLEDGYDQVGFINEESRFWY